MARARTILQSEFPYNISSRCINKEWFKLEMPQVWEIFCEELDRTAKEQKLLIHCFVLMSNHYHLIASTPEANLSECMRELNGRVSRRLTRAGNRINETFAGRYYKCILQNHNYYLNAYKYNYRNPVAAEICEKAEHYPYSTLQFALGIAPKKFPLAEDTTYTCDPKGTLDWLNTKPEEKKLEGVRFGLKHQYFKSKKDRNRSGLLIRDDELL